MIELRSDTFTRPTPEMLVAMLRAPVGDDVYGEDPTVRLLEEKAAAAMGKPDACLTPSGTMANLTALTAHAPRGSRVMVGRESDIYVYEGHGVSVCSGVALDPVAVDAETGQPSLAGMEEALPEDWDDPQFSLPSVVCVENTANRAGGIPLTPDGLRPISDFARSNKMVVHMDGARIFNAAVALGTPSADLARGADSVQFCLSKGLSAPIGSMVAGPTEFVNRVRRVRKMLGGGMRQAGVIAAAGIVALDTMVDRLAEDHANARFLADGLAGIEGIIIDPARVQTNIVMFRVDEPGPPHATLIRLVAERGVRVAELGKGQIRAVTHREVTSADIERAVWTIETVVRDWRKGASSS
jgi:threonine aldolase